MPQIDSAVFSHSSSARTQSETRASDVRPSGIREGVPSLAETAELEASARTRTSVPPASSFSYALARARSPPSVPQICAQQQKELFDRHTHEGLEELRKLDYAEGLLQAADELDRFNNGGMPGMSQRRGRYGQQDGR